MPLANDCVSAASVEPTVLWSLPLFQCNKLHLAVLPSSIPQSKAMRRCPPCVFPPLAFAHEASEITPHLILCSSSACIFSANSELPLILASTLLSSITSWIVISISWDENIEAAAAASGLPSLPAQFNEPQAFRTSPVSSSVSLCSFSFILCFGMSTSSILSSTKAFMSIRMVSPLCRNLLPLKFTPSSPIGSIFPNTNRLCSFFIFSSCRWSPNINRSSTSTATIPCSPWGPCSRKVQGSRLLWR